MRVSVPLCVYVCVCLQRTDLQASACVCVAMFESGKRREQEPWGKRVGECVRLERRGGGRRSQSAVKRVGGEISSNEREGLGEVDDSLVVKVRAGEKRERAKQKTTTRGTAPVWLEEFTSPSASLPPLSAKVSHLQ